ncbi:MAG: NmrA family NAD(P)-binding protein [Proteobacteria bacterium]|nr:NmrA family NAD(P)-binding protein [Pseudomonadota bacterium]
MESRTDRSTSKTVTVFGATGTAGIACVDELIRQKLFDVRVLARKPGLQEKSSSGLTQSEDSKHKQYDEWSRQGVTIKKVDVTAIEELIPVLEGTSYLVSCVPYNATSSQYPLIWACKEAGVERFVPSELGAIYEFEQYLPTDTIHRQMARQKAHIRRIIEATGLDFTIIPAGLWPEYYMLEPVAVMGDGNEKVAWSSGTDAGRIIPHVLAHPASRNAICPVAATAFCSWNELLEVRERVLGRKVDRYYWGSEQWRTAYAKQPPGIISLLMAIGVALTDTPAGMSLFGNWNKTFLPEFKGTPLEEVFRNRVEPFVEGIRAALFASGELPAVEKPEGCAEI